MKNILPRFAFTSCLLNDIDNKTFKKGFNTFQDILIGAYNVVSASSNSDYYEYWIFVNEMIECLESEVESIQDENIDLFNEFMIVLKKLDKVCQKRKVSRLFCDFYC